MAAAETASPGRVVQFVVWEKERPGIVTMSLGRSINADPSGNTSLHIDARTGVIIAAKGPMDFLRVLHGQLFLGTFGPLVLGFITLLFIIAIVSGIVIYAPFMRRLPFGTVRLDRSRRMTWLDLHNLIGIVIAGWLVVVGVTGMMNSWGTYVVNYWRNDQLAHLIADQTDPPLHDLSPVDAAVARAQAATHGMEPYFIALPGSPLTNQNHYAIFMRGDTPLTSRLVTPVIINASTGTIVGQLDRGGPIRSDSFWG